MKPSGKLRLGVNIDHVATVRNARGGSVPEPLRAARIAEAAGADGITAHLREDRRHISDADIEALAANLTACVNRLTALFRQTRFYDKRLFGLVVSGYSGGDLLARQLISALNMNKSFFLPPHFCLLETANERGSLLHLPGIRNTAAAFAREMAE